MKIRLMEAELFVRTDETSSRFS